MIGECWLDTSKNNLRRGRDKQNIAMGINMIQSLDIVSMVKKERDAEGDLTASVCDLG